MPELQAATHVEPTGNPILDALNPPNTFSSENTTDKSQEQTQNGQTQDAASSGGKKGGQGPVKAKDAPGVTAGGQATNKHGQKTGPSGKPQVNNVNKNTREKANNAANKGSGTAEDRTSRTGQPPHFHTKRGDGSRRRDGTHYNYPKR